MRTENITKQNFQGNAMITGTMHQALRTQVVHALNKVNIAQKPYNLYIGNVQNDEFLSITARKNSGAAEKYTVLVHKLSQKADIIKDAVQEAVNKYESLHGNSNKTILK